MKTMKIDLNYQKKRVIKYHPVQVFLLTMCRILCVLEHNFRI